MYKMKKSLFLIMFIVMNNYTSDSIEIGNDYGIREGGWYGNYTSSQSPYTYECSGVPGSTDC
jgi:hypothetical protein